MRKTQPQVSMYVLSVLSVLGYTTTLDVVNHHYYIKDNAYSTIITATQIIHLLFGKQQAQDFFCYIIISSLFQEHHSTTSYYYYYIIFMVWTLKSIYR